MAILSLLFKPDEIARMSDMDADLADSVILREVLTNANIQKELTKQLRAAQKSFKGGEKTSS
jgi:hypothetical protein